MKTTRHAMILQIIDTQDIETQDELAGQLKKHGFNVTQATISRDIKELRLVKVLSPNCNYKYATADRADQGKNDRLIRMFFESVLSVVSSDHLIVIKTLSASANVTAEAIDGLDWPEVIATIAGDNTVLVITRSDCDVNAVVNRFRSLARH
ncbi:MAG: arginine repressor [Clostridia bacterium]|nr:arginine repressor [Clostridia bacterium]